MEPTAGVQVEAQADGRGAFLFFAIKHLFRLISPFAFADCLRLWFCTCRVERERVEMNPSCATRHAMSLLLCRSTTVQ